MSQNGDLLAWRTIISRRLTLCDLGPTEGLLNNDIATCAQEDERVQTRSAGLPKRTTKHPRGESLTLGTERGRDGVREDVDAVQHGCATLVAELDLLVSAGTGSEGEGPALGGSTGSCSSEVTGLREGERERGVRGGSGGREGKSEKNASVREYREGRG